MKETNEQSISFFEKYLSVWVVLCMAAGVLLGSYFPEVPRFLGRLTWAGVSIPVAVLLWFMIYPMMMKVDFQSLCRVGNHPGGLILTWIVNWFIKPFTMLAIGWFCFFILFQHLIPAELAQEYLAGAVLLGAAPCTAMVFVWSCLSKGDISYTVVQVAVNDLTVLILFAPLTAFLLGIGGVTVPWDTLVISVILFVVIPLASGILTRQLAVQKKGREWFQYKFLPRFQPATTGGLLLTLVLIFSFQSKVIVDHPIHIIFIAVPLIIQTFFIFSLAYGAAWLFHLPYDIAAPAAMIGASNFFELSVAVAISLFGAESPAALATTVGVLVEVPVMLILVHIAERTRNWFRQPM